MSAIPCASVNLRTMADGTLRICLDIEPAHAQDAFKLFASPGTPAAIAALQVGYLSKNDGKLDISDEHAPKKPIIEHAKGGALSKLAGMWCASPEFWAWINGAAEMTWPIESADHAAEFVRDMCGIDSRAELDHDEVAAEKFHRLIRGPFAKYTQARG